MSKGSSVPRHPYPVGGAANTAEPALPKAVLLGLQQKQAIINQVIEGRLPLWEAASRFQAVCRQIIGWVHLVLSDRPEQADRVSERLEGELREHLTKNAVALTPPR